MTTTTVTVYLPHQMDTFTRFGKTHEIAKPFTKEFTAWTKLHRIKRSRYIGVASSTVSFIELDEAALMHFMLSEWREFVPPVPKGKTHDFIKKKLSQYMKDSHLIGSYHRHAYDRWDSWTYEQECKHAYPWDIKIPKIKIKVARDYFAEHDPETLDYIARCYEF